jgi:DNA-nicking Smr family endonuclease
MTQQIIDTADTDFIQAMQGVKRLVGFNRADIRPEKQVIRRTASHKKMMAQDTNLAPWEQLTSADSVRAHCNLSFQQGTVTAKQLTRLRRGNFSTPCVIDLHGLTEAQAQARLTQWLLRCRHKTVRYALIIHGKGLGSTTENPVLKNFVNWWLRNQPRILAFSSALPADGGTGAIYALLAAA